MASAAFSNSLLSPAPISQSSFSHQQVSLNPSRISLRSQTKFTHLKKMKKNSTHFTTYCSLDAAKDPNEDVPIELSKDICCAIMGSSLFSSLFLFFFGMLNYVDAFSAGYAAFPSVMDINRIREILPHR